MARSGWPELRFGSREKRSNAVPSSSVMATVMSASDGQFRVRLVGLPVMATMVGGSKRLLFSASSSVMERFMASSLEASTSRALSTATNASSLISV